MRPSVLFRLPFVLSGAKNSRTIIRVNGRSFPMTNDRVKKQWGEIAKMVQALKDSGHWPDFGDDELAVDLDYDVPSKSCLVRIRSLGPSCKGQTGRGHDLDNMLATLFDGLSRAGGINDDRQIARTTATRWPKGLNPA